jgi:hypothetical protein
VLEIDREREQGGDEGTVKLGRGKKKRVARTKRMQ